MTKDLTIWGLCGFRVGILQLCPVCSLWTSRAVGSAYTRLLSPAERFSFPGDAPLLLLPCSRRSFPSSGNSFSILSHMETLI